jgi:hypothetical protein
MTPLDHTRVRLAALSADHGLTFAQVAAHDRHAKLVAARRHVASHLRADGLTFQHIGRLMGREWSTIRDLLRPRATA